jgi:hypothetical protein
LCWHEASICRAYTTALTLPASAYGAEPHLKLSGVAVALAEVLQDAGKPADAYAILLSALDRIRDAGKHAQPTPTSSAARPTPGPSSSSSADAPADAAFVTDLPPPTPRERMRAVALSAKLGAMAEEYALPAVEEEAQLGFAVEEMLRAVNALPSALPTASPLEALARLVSPRAKGDAKEEEGSVVLAELELAGRVSTKDVGAPLEALGAFYVRVGRVEWEQALTFF